MRAPRHTARGIVIRDDKLLLIERFRGNMHYHSIPGGGIESGETPEQTVVREIAEETSCHVRVVRPLYLLRRGSVEHHIFLCEYVSGEAHLPEDSPEARSTRPNNQFIPIWLPLRNLSSAPFLIWKPIQRQLMHDLRHGYAKKVIQIVARPLG